MTTPTPDLTPKMTLVLHVTVPGFHADDLDASAREYADGEPTAADRLEVVLEEWMRQEVGIALVPLDSDHGLFVYKGRIVGAELRNREPRDDA